MKSSGIEGERCSHASSSEESRKMKRDIIATIERTKLLRENLFNELCASSFVCLASDEQK